MGCDGWIRIYDVDGLMANGLWDEFVEVFAHVYERRVEEHTFLRKNIATVYWDTEYRELTRGEGDQHRFDDQLLAEWKVWT